MPFASVFRSFPSAVFRSVALLLIGGTLLIAPQAVTPAVAQTQSVDAELSATLQSIFQKGQSLEAERKWGEALTHYEDALKDIPGSATLKQRYDWARLNYDLGRRYKDNSYRRSTVEQTEQQALDLYSEVLVKLESHYVHQISWKNIVARGTRSLNIALGKEYFAEQHLRGVSEQMISDARDRLQQAMQAQSIRSRADARLAVLTAGRLLQNELGLRSTATIMEYACAAVGGLDPYSSYLTADQLRDVYSQIDGNFVGLGIELKADDGSLLIVSVIKGSPAALGGMRAGDRILSIDGRTTSDLDTDAAAQILQGPENSVVELEIFHENEPRRTVSVRRRHVEVPSIEDAEIVDPASGVAYLKIVSFQRRTSRDLDTALWRLYHAGMKSLVIDLRGNPGGLLSSSVDIADKFVPRGTIVSTRGRNKAEDYDYSARTMSTWQVPLVVLIDENSASASEIFAAAIHDHRRGTVVGHRSYGKGSVQGIFPLSRAGAGLRLTTAKFYAPSGRPISNVGVKPHVTVHLTHKPAGGENFDPLAPLDQDEMLNAAIQVARRQLAQR